MSITPGHPLLEIADLRLVTVLAESGSTVSASAVLHLDQSAVSRRLLAVERKLETALFERRARGLSLTAAGRRFVGAAGPLLAQLREMEHAVRHGTSCASPLVLVCECYTAYRWLPAALPALERELGRELRVALEHTAAPVEALQRSKVDLALLTTARVPRSQRELALLHDEIVFVVSAKHPLAARGVVSAAELAQVPLIVSTATPERERRWFLRQVFGARPPHVRRIAFPLTETVIDATRAQMGVAPMSEWVAREYLAPGELMALRLQKKRLRRPWRLAFRPGSEHLAEQLAAALRASAPSVWHERSLATSSA